MKAASGAISASQREWEKPLIAKLRSHGGHFRRSTSEGGREFRLGPFVVTFPKRASDAHTRTSIGKEVNSVLERYLEWRQREDQSDPLRGVDVASIQRSHAVDSAPKEGAPPVDDTLLGSPPAA